MNTVELQQYSCCPRKIKSMLFSFYCNRLLSLRARILIKNLHYRDPEVSINKKESQKELCQAQQTGRQISRESQKD